MNVHTLSPSLTVEDGTIADAVQSPSSTAFDSVRTFFGSTDAGDGCTQAAYDVRYTLGGQIGEVDVTVQVKEASEEKVIVNIL
tara:strand:+ start:311 stop:559 length:249 start_codon:yes stop_codon:yes gene_type:complete